MGITIPSDEYIPVSVNVIETEALSQDLTYPIPYDEYNINSRKGYFKLVNIETRIRPNY